MSDLHDDYERAYLRRVHDPNPLVEELARLAADAVDRRTEGVRPVPWTIIHAAASEFGVPIAYVLDELERRVREHGGV